MCHVFVAVVIDHGSCFGIEGLNGLKNAVLMLNLRRNLISNNLKRDVDILPG